MTRSSPPARAGRGHAGRGAPADAGLARARLAAQRIGNPRAAAPAEVVAWLGAIQAQDRAAAKWAVGLRLPEGAATDADVERALDDGDILRTHLMRGTWQLVSPADLQWIRALVAPGIIAGSARRYRELGLDAATFRRSETALAGALGQGEHLTRDELAVALGAGGVRDAEGQRLSHLIGRAELDGLICSGARRGKESTYALVDRRLRLPNRRLAHDEARAELARRYFESRGPATIEDFVWWSGLAAGDARAGLEAVASTLISEVIGGRSTWRARGVDSAAPASAARPAGDAYLLPAFDEYLLAYRDRAAVLDPRHAKRVNAGGGMLKPCLVVGGRVAGTWRRVSTRTTATVEIDPFEPLAPSPARSAAAAARRYGAFLGVEGARSSRSIIAVGVAVGGAAASAPRGRPPGPAEDHD